MANITNFEFIEDEKIVSRVEVSLDGGITYGVLWEELIDSDMDKTVIVQDGEYTNEIGYYV